MTDVGFIITSPDAVLGRTLGGPALKSRGGGVKQGSPAGPGDSQKEQRGKVQGPVHGGGQEAPKQEAGRGPGTQPPNRSTMTELQGP